MSWQTRQNDPDAALTLAKLAAASRDQTAQTEAQSREEVAARMAGDIRGTGTLTHYRPVGGWRTPGPGAGTTGEGSPGSLRAAADAAELGSPTSFDGGAGAPESIGVIRGNRQTFAPQRQEGQQFIEGEFSTPLRAAQAYNRAAGNSEVGFEPVGGPELRLKADLERKSPEKVAQADVIRDAAGNKAQQDAMGHLRKVLLLTPGLAIKDKEGNATLPEYAERELLKHTSSIKTMNDVPGVLNTLTPVLDTAKKISTLDTEAGRGRIMGNYKTSVGRDLTPDEQKHFISSPITPENYQGFQQWHDYKKPAAPKTEVQGQNASDTEAGASLLDRAALLGKSFSYELQPSLRMGGVRPPTLESVRNERITKRNKVWDEEGKLRAGVPNAM
jgi:hypothetical protein